VLVLELTTEAAPAAAMAATVIGTDSIKELTAGLEQEIMVEMLSTLQSTASMVAGICVQRLTDLREQMLREFQEREQLHRLSAAQQALPVDGEPVGEVPRQDREALAAPAPAVLASPRGSSTGSSASAPKETPSSTSTSVPACEVTGTCSSDSMADQGGGNRSDSAPAASDADDEVAGPQEGAAACAAQGLRERDEEPRSRRRGGWTRKISLSSSGPHVALPEKQEPVIRSDSTAAAPDAASEYAAMSSVAASSGVSVRIDAPEVAPLATTMAAADVSGPPSQVSAVHIAGAPAECFLVASDDEAVASSDGDDFIGVGFETFHVVDKERKARERLERRLAAEEEAQRAMEAELEEQRVEENHRKALQDMSAADNPGEVCSNCNKYSKSGRRGDSGTQYATIWYCTACWNSWDPPEAPPTAAVPAFRTSRAGVFSKTLRVG